MGREMEMEIVGHRKWEMGLVVISSCPSVLCSPAAKCFVSQLGRDHDECVVDDGKTHTARVRVRIRAG